MATPDVKIAAIPGVGYIVPSRDFCPGAFWLVTEKGCTCPAKGGCYHIGVVLEHVRAVEATRLPPLSVARPNISAMVD